jgi:DNA topoisomerase VI subunit B
MGTVSGLNKCYKKFKILLPIVTRGLIELGATESENDFQIFIRDNGVGIAEAYHDKIFKVFTKLDSNNKIIWNRSFDS